jgi:serine/threonine-protein kinase
MTRALEPGAVVGGKYSLLRRLGVGGMGEVWAARNRTTDAEVAVKMGLGAAAQEDSVRRFRHEARLGAMLAHRSIVRIFDLVEEDDGTLVLVMELLKGETVEHYLRRRGPLPTPEATAIVVPILSALAHAHATGVVHRDVTPANIFLAIDPDGHVTPKLLDFGIAKVPTMARSHTLEGRALGTPRYMAPERIREEEDIDGRCDLFSVGVILYELLTGVCPFAAGSPAASLAAVLEVVVDPDPRIDPLVWLELRRALSKRPYERPPTPAALADHLLLASGQTEATLIEVLRKAPLSQALPEEDLDPARRAQTVGGQSLGGPKGLPVPRRRLARVGIAMGLFLCMVVAIVGSSIRDRTPATPASLPPVPTEAPRASAVATEPAIEFISPRPSAASTSTVSTTPAPRAAPARPPRTPRPKPVATTPGF